MNSILLLASLTTSLFAGHAPKLELEMTSSQYQALLQLHTATYDDFDKSMALGKRNLEWLVYINNLREVGKKISFSSPETQPAYPIATPRISNPKLINEEYAQVSSELPLPFKAVLIDGKPFTDNPPGSDQEFIQWGLRIDRHYQRAARWILQEPYLDEYAQEKENDIRGYYYLSNMKDVESYLRNFESLNTKEQALVKGWLIEMCMNSGTSEDSCESEVERHLPRAAYTIYSKYLPKSESLWNGFFELAGTRPEAVWNKLNPNLFTIPFVDPKKDNVKAFLADNIQDEWKWNEWQLKLDFLPRGKAQVHVEFVPGSTPHVNGIAGDTITMDDNAPLSEYDVQWTIRHEFGHVLGFPDCYVEFYDGTESAMISYQLDITNLMCSRRGHLQEKHFNEMKRGYFKG